jgi:Carboxypeptidase regulatory-like domain
MTWRRLAIALAALGLTGCGAHGATVTVAVSDASGEPLRGARVWLVGTKHDATSDAAGNAAIHDIKAGIYELKAGKSGYVQQSTHVTVAKDSDPEPQEIALPYSPPLGTFVDHPKSTEWLVLQVTSVAPWKVTLRTIEWGCWVQTWDHHDDQSPALDVKKSRLDSHPSVEITGPNSLDPSWQRQTPGALPDTSVDAAPKGACNGSVAAWDHSR